MQLRLCLALINDAGVVGPFVFAPQPRQQIQRLSVADTVAFAEPVGQRQQQDDQRLLIFRVGSQHVQADALRFGRFVEQSVTRRLVQRRRNRLSGKRFELKHGPVMMNDE
ncbi:MAG: hypothetical protein DME22_00850 [Verrucomicrobia bacterium]|nr:MAG: hypothetical protein DME22_00850 [Verrucomicrobiota bacterium]